MSARSYSAVSALSSDFLYGGVYALAGVATESGKRVFAERLSEATVGEPTAAVAERLGISEAALSRYKSGKREPESLSLLANIARRLGRSVDWLLGLEPDLPRPAPEVRGAEDWHSLPKVAFTSAGSPIHDELLKDDTVFYAFHRSWVTRRAGRAAADDKERLIVVQVDKKHLGESMIPTVRPGAILVVDRGPRGQGIADPKELRPGSMYLVHVDDGLTVKRAFFTDGVLTLVSDNPDRRAYPPRVLSMKNRTLQKTVIGRVIWVGHEED